MTNNFRTEFQIKNASTIGNHSKFRISNEGGPESIISCISSFGENDRMIFGTKNGFLHIFNNRENSTEKKINCEIVPQYVLPIPSKSQIIVVGEPPKKKTEKKFVKFFSIKNFEEKHNFEIVPSKQKICFIDFTSQQNDSGILLVVLGSLFLQYQINENSKLTLLNQYDSKNLGVEKIQKMC